ncbi:type II secretion system protein GspE [Candidatus Woesebacteria bacterium]|nr:type II secretion system protein GspE [Candidatus Woesebacteria bacterium]
MPQSAQASPVKQPQNGNGPSSSQTGGKSLVDLLLSQGAINQQQADKIKLQEVQTGKTQAEVLGSDSTISEEALTQAKATLYKVPYIDLEKAPISPEALAILPQSVASRFLVLPASVDRDKNELILAMGNPLDLAAVEFVEQKSGMRVRPMTAIPSKIEKIISERYSVGLAQEVTAAIKEATPEDGARTVDLSRLSQVISEAPIAKIVKELLGFAVKSRASDVHIEPEEKTTRIRYRVDGILQEKFTMPKQFHESLISRIKILGGMKIDEKRIPQDGRFNFKAGVEEVDLRVSSLPTVHGEKIVMRLLKKTGGVPKLQELGLRGRALKNLEDAVLRPHGIILVTGPTGSGKTTTLYSILSRINTPKVNVVTLEDPVEYQISGINQVQVNADAGLTFASGLRSFLRQDPNIVMVGEIRDAETAELAIQASLTGHLVFSTLHTNDSAGAIPRLLDMGAEPFLLASAITAIVAQRVTRRIHDKCKEEYVPEPAVVEDMKKVLGNLWPVSPGASQGGPASPGTPPVQGQAQGASNGVQKQVQAGSTTGEVKLYKGSGDSECGNTGYHGRVGVFEVMPITEKIARLTLERAPAANIAKQAQEEGMITMKQDGYLKVLEGMTTMEEVLRVAQE